MRSIRVQQMPLRRTPHHARIEPRRLHQNIPGLRRNHRVPAAHHTSKAQRLLLIGDHQIIRIEKALHAIERAQLLAVARAADNDPALQLVQIERVRRLPHRQHNIIGRIDSVENRLLLQQPEPLRHHARRRRKPNIEQHPRREPPAQLRLFDRHRHGPCCDPRCRQTRIEQLQLEPVDRRRLTRNAVVIHRIDAIGRDVHLEQRPVRP